MSGYVLIVCCLVVTRLWWLAARDTITEPLWRPIEERDDKFSEGWFCPWCSSAWWAVPVVIAAWHATPVEGAWFVWQPAAVLICSLVCATYVHVVDSLDP